MITVRGTAVYDDKGMLFIPDSLVASAAERDELMFELEQQAQRETARRLSR